MKKTVFWCFLWAGFLIEKYSSGPVSVLSKELSNSIEDEDEDDEMPLLDDDFTTHGLERLSSAATCLVAGVEYTHGQQIYRRDPCEFCLCLDGEMFCWWQDCPPTMDGPCKDKGPFSPCIIVQVSPLLTSTPSTSSTNTKVSNKLTELSNNKFRKLLNNLKNSTIHQDQWYSTEQIGQTEPPISETSTTEISKECIVMGQRYTIGSKLPHDTGNCLECICDQGAKISCSPHQCTPAGEEINDYHPSGSRQSIPDIF